jgi:hypothetical protein
MKYVSRFLEKIGWLPNIFKKYKQLENQSIKTPANHIYGHDKGYQADDSP